MDAQISAYQEFYLLYIKVQAYSELHSIAGRSHVITTTTARLAQLGECQSAEREVASSNPGRTNTQGLKNN